jgi:conjugative relaxase-like TrwC/TraI family protein
MFAVQIARSKSGALAYLREHMANADYLTEQGEQMLVWHGSGAGRLGLRGQVTEKVYANLLSGLTPDSTARNQVSLTARQKKDRRCAFQAVLSAPKSVSVAALVFGDARLVEAHNGAVQATLKVLESECALTRVRKAGRMEDRKTGNLIMAVVTHDSTRPVVVEGKEFIDPQLHSHIAIPNLTYDAREKQWKAVNPLDLFKRQALIREIYWHELARRCAALGYGIKQEEYGFNLAGYEHFNPRFSKRSDQIDRYREEHGLSNTARGNAFAAAESRDRKSKRQRSDLVKEWRSQITSSEQANLPRPSAPTEVIRRSVEEVRGLAIEHLSDRQSIFPDSDLLADMVKRARGSSLNFDEIRASVDRDTTLIRSGDRLTTLEALRLERDLIQFVRGGRNRCLPFARDPVLPPGLDDDQAKALRGLLSSRDSVLNLIGDAGTGKSTVTPEFLQHAKVPALLLSPNLGGRDSLRELATTHREARVAQAFGETETVAAALTNQRLFERAREGLILVDEAGQLGVRDLNEIFRAAKKVNARVLLVGDTKQHHGVPAGDALRILKRHAGLKSQRLSQIYRQKPNLDYLQIVSLLAQGKLNLASAFLQKQGWVTQLKDEKERARAVAEELLRLRNEGKTARVVAPTWAEINRIGEAVRTSRRENGGLQGEDVNLRVVDDLKWTPAQRRDFVEYKSDQVITLIQGIKGIGRRGERFQVIRAKAHGLEVQDGAGKEQFLPFDRAKRWSVGEHRDIALAQGDEILIRANHPKAKLRNGEVDVISHVTPDVIVLKSGRVFSPKEFKQFGYGYAVTSYAAQGQTVDNVIVSAPAQPRQSLSREGWYVMLSRGRESLRVFTDDWATLKERVLREDHRMAAVELPALKRGARQALSRTQLMVARNLRKLRAWKKRPRVAAKTNSVTPRIDRRDQ